jgi:hypothetical protein
MTRAVSFFALFWLTSVCYAQDNPIDSINEEYKKKIKPIFEQKCMDCHSSKTQWPWYHKIPGIKQLLDHDVAEGREHIDFSNDFPFEGHGTPYEDIHAIHKAIEEDSMPPFEYRLMHPNSKLNTQEKQTVLEWAKRCTEIIQKWIDKPTDSKEQ